jgi:hypothetical protein
MHNIHDLAEYICRFVDQWSTAISDPRHYVSTHPHVVDSVEFYLSIMIFSFVLQAPFVLGQKAEFGEKTRLAASSLVGLVSTAVIASTWHLGFAVWGGHATFQGTWIAYVYSAAPYIPLASLASLIIFAGLPADLQHYALLPAHANAVIAKALADPRTKKGLVGIGSLSLVCIIVWSVFVQLRSMRFVHQVSGVRFFACVVTCLLITAVVGPLMRAIVSVFNPPSPADQLPSQNDTPPVTEAVAAPAGATST